MEDVDVNSQVDKVPHRPTITSVTVITQYSANVKHKQISSQPLLKQQQPVRRAHFAQEKAIFCLLLENFFFYYFQPVHKDHLSTKTSVFFSGKWSFSQVLL